LDGLGAGSFTFQPHVRNGRGPAAGSSNGSNQLICQPFQLPDFFSRDDRVSCTSPKGSVSTPGAATAAAGAGGRGGECGGSPLRPAVVQHQLSDNLSNLRLAEGRISMVMTAAEGAPGSPCRARHLQHSFSMPAHFRSQAGGVGDAFAAAVAAAVSANGGSGCAGQQDGGQPQGQGGEQAVQAPYSEVFKTIWGPQPAATGQQG
jgi:hypothetical protein